MKRIFSVFSYIPIHWKLTLWSALLLCLLFAANNVVQFVFVEKWMMKQEEQEIERDMKELLNLLLAKEVAFEKENYALIRTQLERINVRNGMIRIISDEGNPIIVAADNMSDEWVSRKITDENSKNILQIEDEMIVMRRSITIFNFQGTVEVVRSIAEVERLIMAFYRIMVISSIVVIIISGLGGRLLARGLMKPLQSMNETIRKVKQNGLKERMSPGLANDDISSLKIMFNEMMDQVERSFHQQKQFVEDASHELRTPIAIIEGHLALLRRWGKNDPKVLEESLQISMTELVRLKKLVEDLLTLSRAEKLNSVRVEEYCSDPMEVISEAVKKRAVVHPDFHFKLELEYFQLITLRISDMQLEQIIQILLDNAIKYSGNSKNIVILTSRSNGDAILTIKDYGIGISEQDLPFVWDRFYRADKSRNGSSEGYGLGLSIAKQLAVSLQGDVRLMNNPEGGTSALLVLPIYEETIK
ncbi:histidine kinase [Paenibacillus sp. GSMTC-2017]|uniref:sensor histidine kinase n=1 Tax=Paenibacillus sp. GSMTC-2017 TaxID=2794350 RepID=UPI0018D97133|nr:HAMP domain-containing histidine kinase [Paenibacillus sp. GSMTC-2017]MBH5317450.1 histidine kinase [Paenibacillus sp. GSMTC-2017]